MITKTSFYSFTASHSHALKVIIFNEIFGFTSPLKWEAKLIDLVSNMV